MNTSVSISPGNSKLGSIPSVSLPPVYTCPRGCECATLCYAMRLARARPSVKHAYDRNLYVLRSDPVTYWREVEAAVMMSRFFRFHVAGDIPDGVYLGNMIRVAKRCRHCQILCFTKQYGIVNNYLSSGGKLPKNLHLIFSVWRGFPMENPFRLPEAHVRYRDGTTTSSEDALPCGGNCSDCAMESGGCWKLKSGQQIVFDQH